MATVALNQIQRRPRDARATLPLVLVHDSSGIGFNYHLLDNLRRDVYGIEDPLFGTDKAWEGGIPEMAKAYASAVVATVSEGPIILGGWSLGGMIAIEMCRILQTTTNTKVSGIVLIDTPSTQHWTSLGPNVVKYEPEVTSTSTWVREGVKRRFEMAGDLVDNWQFPSASDLKRPGLEPQIPMEGCSYRSFPVAAAGYLSGAAAAGTGMARLKFDRDFNNDLRLQHQRALLPPTMLLRAVEAVPKKFANEESQFRIDLNRDSPLLGWEHGAINFIRVVQDTPGNHYNMFEGDKKIRALTSAINTWCSMVDDLPGQIHTQ